MDARQVHQHLLHLFLSTQFQPNPFFFYTVLTHWKRILLSFLLDPIGAIQWEICERVKQAQNNCTFSAACSLIQVFLPSGLHSSVIHWAHSSSFWGKKNICVNIWQQFWWKSLFNVTEYLAACQICAQNEGSNQVSPGLLHPLPGPNPPWSRMSLDFVSGLPPSDGNTMLIVEDRFS